jgi:hypothetical protein
VHWPVYVQSLAVAFNVLSIDTDVILLAFNQVIDGVAQVDWQYPSNASPRDLATFSVLDNVSANCCPTIVSRRLPGNSDTGSGDLCDEKGSSWTAWLIVNSWHNIWNMKLQC